MHKLICYSAAATMSLLLIQTVRLKASERIYNSALPATVWVKAPMGNGKFSYGSGVLIDAERRWVVTSYHIVEDQSKAQVFFAIRHKNGIVAERERYRWQQPGQSISARVVAHDAAKDLALLELDHAPVFAKALALAKFGPRPGQDVHVVGNPQGQVLWVYTFGKVRSVFHKRWNVRLDSGRLLVLGSRVVETNLAINAGDSGAPVVNNAGELVALVSSFQKDKRLVTTCIHAGEIKEFLRRAKKGDSNAELDSILSFGKLKSVSNLLEAKKQIRANPIRDTNHPLAGILDQTAFRNKYRAQPDSVFRVEISQRTPFVYVDAQVDQFKRLKVRRVWSIGKVLETKPSAQYMLQLLMTNHDRTLGAWAVQKMRSGKYVLVFCHRMPAETAAADLEAAIYFVHDEAWGLQKGKSNKADR